MLLILSAVFLLRPSRKLVLSALLFTMPLAYLLNVFIPDMNYFVRSGWVIVVSFAMVAAPTFLQHGWRIPFNELMAISNKRIGWAGFALLVSLAISHI